MNQLKAPFEADGFYHIINHAVGNEQLFREADNYRYFLKQYDYYLSSVWETYAYCLMPNHFHLLVKIRNFSTLASLPKFNGDIHKLISQTMSNWLNGYAKAYNKKYNRKGGLFIDCTKRILVDSEEYYTSVINYIHQNPVNHGFCKNPTEWSWSSYNSFISDKLTKLNKYQVLKWFGGKDAFIKFHNGN